MFHTSAPHPRERVSQPMMVNETVPLHRRPLESTAIRSVGYDPARRHLDIEFAGGAVYRYLGVPPREYAALLAAESHGRYVNTRIRDRYRWVRVRSPIER
jgi:KTSC domain-containing protein